MSELYSKFFETGDIYDGLGRLLYARKESKLSDKQMHNIANELAELGKIDKSSSFEKKHWWLWNEYYVNFLMNGMSTGRVSRDYLIYFSNVRKITTIKSVVINILVIVAILIVIFAISYYFKP